MGLSVSQKACVCLDYHIYYNYHDVYNDDDYNNNYEVILFRFIIRIPDTGSSILFKGIIMHVVYYQIKLCHRIPRP